jgi:ferredoxin
LARVNLDGQIVEVKDGDAILDACEELGIMFGCQAGNCGTCLTEIADGMECLSDYSEPEKQFGVEGRERLLCQCSIKGGEVVLDAP